MADAVKLSPEVRRVLELVGVEVGDLDTREPALQVLDIVAVELRIVADRCTNGDDASRQATQLAVRVEAAVAELERLHRKAEGRS